MKILQRFAKNSEPKMVEFTDYEDRASDFFEMLLDDGASPQLAAYVTKIRYAGVDRDFLRFKMGPI